MAKNLDSRDRCDHCKKWISWGRKREPLGTLEGIVSPGVDINWAVCDRCFKQKGTEAQYWDGWVERQTLKLQENS